ncbi:uncharacterized protein V6R79_007358 [Siganus canaliculatus]
MTSTRLDVTCCHGNPRSRSPRIIKVESMATSRTGENASDRKSLPEEEEEEERSSVTMFDDVHRKKREKTVLQRLVVVARLPQRLSDRTEVGAHFEKLRFQLNRDHLWDQTTGVLLLYPSCLLHVIESSREVLRSVLEDLTEQQRSRVLLEDPKIVFIAHNPPSRLFHQWSYQVLEAQQRPGFRSEEDGREGLVGSVLSALQKLGEDVETSKGPPGSVLDQTPELMVSQDVLDQLLDRDDLLSPQQHLNMYSSLPDVSVSFGERTLHTGPPRIHHGDRPQQRCKQDLTLDHEQDLTLTLDHEQDLTLDHEQDLTLDHEQDLTLTLDHEQDLTLDHEQDLTLDHEQDLTLDHEQDPTLDHEQDPTLDHEQDLTLDHEQDLTQDHEQDPTLD